MYICDSCKKTKTKNEISMGMGTPEGPKYFCYECKPIPKDDDDENGEYGMGGDWWKNV